VLQPVNAGLPALVRFEGKPTVMRKLAISLALTVAATSAPGAELALQQVSVASRGGDVQVRCYSVPGAGALPAVVLLHGASGFGPFSRHYESYAESLAAAGFRTCAVLYYSASDSRVLAEGSQTEKSALFGKRFMAWVATINDVVDGLSKLPIVEPESLGILGFSQGAYLAVGVAGTNRRIKALAEFYGGFPGPLENQITQLPPTLIVHGESDTVIPVQEAYVMEAAAKLRTTSVATKVYTGAGHGFDVPAGDPNAVAARKETIDFFVRHLPRTRK
jgi:dienelactone hydrolase